MICEAKENYAPTGKNTLTFGLLDFFLNLFLIQTYLP